MCRSPRFTRGVSGFLLVLMVATGAAVVEPSADNVPPTMDLEARRSRAEQQHPALLTLTGQFEARTFRNDNEEVIPYRLFKPERDLAKSYPLIIYLHGSAGRGTDNVKQISGGNIYGARVWALPNNQSERPCFVLAPQLMESVVNRPEMTVHGEKIEDAVGEVMAGSWRLRVDGPSGTIVMQLSLRGKDDSLLGSIRVPRRGTLTLERVAYDNGTLTFTTDGGLSLRGEFEVQGKRFVGKLATLRSRERAAALMALILRIADEFSVDRRRIYITGQSMGGGGTWGMLAHYTDFFAAAVPVCGTGNIDSAKSIVNGGTAIWTFHGDADPRVPVENTRRMLAALRDAGGRPRYTEYPGVKHDSWVDAYLEPNMQHWLFEQSRSN